MWGLIVGYIIIGAILFVILYPNRDNKYYECWYHLNIFEHNWIILLSSILWPISLVYILVVAFFIWLFNN